LTSAEDEPAADDDKYEANDCPHQLASHEASWQNVYPLKEKRSADEDEQHSKYRPDESHVWPNYFFVKVTLPTGTTAPLMTK